jgi:hypothetical protein
VISLLLFTLVLGGGGTWWGEKVGRCAFVGVIFDRSSRLDGGGNSTAGRRILQTRHTVT